MSGGERNVNNPRIFISKSDVRRDYAKKFADAFNACDVKIILKFLEDYCIKDCLLIQQCIGKENPFIPKYIEVLGIYLFISMFFFAPVDFLLYCRHSCDSRVLENTLHDCA